MFIYAFIDFISTDQNYGFWAYSLWNSKSLADGKKNISKIIFWRNSTDANKYILQQKTKKSTVNIDR